MPNQITLAFSVATAATIYSPAQAAAKLAAVPLYAAAGTDPVLGQAFGLTVASDASAPYSQAILTATDASPIVVGVASTEGLANGMVATIVGATGNTAANGSFKIAALTPTGFALIGSTGNGAYTGGGTVTAPVATRTLTLNMTSVDYPTAPPPFPCRPTGPLEPPPGAPYSQGAMAYSQAVLTATNTSPIVAGVASTAGLTNGMVVTVVDATGNTAANGSFEIAALTMNSFALVGSTGNGAYTGGGMVAIPYELTQTTIDRYTRRPVTKPVPAAVVAFYSTSNLDTDGVDTIPAIPAGSGAQIMALTYLDSTGAGPFTVYTKLMGKYPAVVTLHAGSIDVAEIAECFVYQTGAFENSVGEITLSALAAPLPVIPADATPADFKGLTDAAQMTIIRPLIYLPPSYFALSQQQNSAPQLAGDFWVKQNSPTVLTTISQLGVLAATNIVEFAAQPGVQYEVASVSATLIQLTTRYTGLSHPEIAPGSDTHHEFANHHPSQSVSEEADAVVSSAVLVDPSQAAPPDNAHLMTLLAEFTLPQSTAPALTYVDESGPFTVGETVKGQKSGGVGIVLYDNQGVDDTGILAFNPGSVKSGFVRSETITGQTSSATATVVEPRTLASNPLPTKLSGLYARTLSLVLGAPVVSQPITLV
jgi:hypothetical protein